MKRYDIIVIGAGAGGLNAALFAKQHGVKVALMEKSKIGGDCTHFGCIPSKTFINSARLFDEMKHASDIGLPHVDVEGRFNFADVMDHINEVIDDIYLDEWPVKYKDSGVDVIVHESGARFLNSHEIEMGGEIYYTEHAIICTGASPRHAKIKGSDDLTFLNYESFWDTRDMPHGIVFLGGGLVSAEIGQALRRFGCHVSFIEREERILPFIDEDVGALISDIFNREGMHIYTKAQIDFCEPLGDGRTRIYIVQEDGRKTITARTLFVALGRDPNVTGLGLGQAGVKYDEWNGIQTNEYLQTSAENIYACGDVATKAMFTHVAEYQAEVCVENIIGGNHMINDLSVLPWVIFTSPEIAHVGLNEAQAREKHGEVQVIKVDATLDRFITEGRTEGFLKVVFDKQDRVVGADAIGIHAGEWIQLITHAIKQNLTPKDFAETIVAYPTHAQIVKSAFTKFLDSKHVG